MLAKHTWVIQTYYLYTIYHTQDQLKPNPSKRFELLHFMNVIVYRKLQIMWVARRRVRK